MELHNKANVGIESGIECILYVGIKGGINDSIYIWNKKWNKIKNGRLE